MTRGSGLDNKEIRWSIDNVYKETSRTIWGFAAFNLTSDQSQDLTIGKHVITATFAGDYDYAASNATTTFSVQTAATPTPRKATPNPADTTVSITLNVPNYPVQPGSATLTGTYSGLVGNQYLNVLIKPLGANAYKVQSAPIRYINGTYSVSMNFETSGNNEIDVLVMTSALSPGSSITTLPKPPEFSASVTVK
jgi:predicted phage tail protein